MERQLKAVYVFPNDMVASIDHRGEQIGELQGRRTDEKLEAKLVEASRDDTRWHGWKPLWAKGALVA